MYPKIYPSNIYIDQIFGITPTLMFLRGVARLYVVTVMMKPHTILQLWGHSVAVWKM
jgi:hypothetical protein